MKKINLLLLSVLVLAFILRFWHLGNYPALNADEAAIGYNAYSLINTGLDEHGGSWPIHFQSFNDYKPGLYFYLVLPFIKFTGLNAWAVRIPNAFLGVMTVYLLYLIVLKIPSLRKIGNPKYIALVAALFLAINPWHIHFSRGGWEVNTATFFMVLGIYLYLKSLENIKYLLLSSVLFCLSLYTYHAARIVTPLLIIGILAIYRSELVKNIKKYLICAFCAILVLLPLAKDLIKPEISSRAAGVGLFADPGPINRINEQRGEHGNFNGAIAKTLHNKFVNYTLAFIDNWTAHYHGLFLFLSGDDIERDKVPETGQMYMLDVLWLILGIFWIIKNSDKATRLMLYWLVIAPSAAALTFQSPHALRAENMVIPLTMITAIGFCYAMTFVSALKSKTYVRSLSYLFVAFLLIWQFARYEHMYWVHMSKEYPFSSQYGVAELVGFVTDNEATYKNIIVTSRYDQPYILFLFYSKYPPEKFQKEHDLTKRDSYGFSTVASFDKYIFKSIDWDEDKLKYPDSLIIGTREEIPKEANVVKKIYGSNGYEYFDIVAN